MTEAAHRVRTPLATVRAHAETTLQRVEKPKNRQALRAMVRAIDESSRAAGQLLDHAMIAFRADNMEQQDINLGVLGQELLMQLTPIAEMKDIAFEMTQEPDVMMVGDPILMQNAVRNLIDNALKYAPAESTISIFVSQSPSPNVETCDQGKGFAPDEIGDLANRFKRGANVAGIVGSGLGLTIVEDVAHAHGGKLTLTNRPQGGGMRYFIVLIMVLWPCSLVAQDWEDQQLFGAEGAAENLTLISSTDTSFFAPIIESFLRGRPNVSISYFVTGTADLDAIFRTDPDRYHVVISSAMDLQLKLANDGFALRIDNIAHPAWAQWRQSLFWFHDRTRNHCHQQSGFCRPTDAADPPRADPSPTRQPRSVSGQGGGTYDVRQLGLGYLFATQDARASESFWRLTEVMGSLDAQLHCCSGDMIDDLADGTLAVAYNVLGSYASARSEALGDLEVILLQISLQQ